MPGLESGKPLVLDADGTLLRTDMLLERDLEGVRHGPRGDAKGVYPGRGPRHV